jgi:hypothetical protein
VLAAVRYYLPIYRSVTAHPALVPGAVEGSPEARRPGELHAAAWELVAPMFESSRRAAETHLRSALASGRAVTGAAAVAEAADAGRVATLFLVDDEPVWGRLEGGRAEVHEHRGQSDVDLLERAATATRSAGGVVYTDAAAVVSDSANSAAVLRW